MSGALGIAAAACAIEPTDDPDTGGAAGMVGSSGKGGAGGSTAGTGVGGGSGGSGTAGTAPTAGTGTAGTSSTGGAGAGGTGAGGTLGGSGGSAPAAGAGGAPTAGTGGTSTAGAGGSPSGGSAGSATAGSGGSSGGSAGTSGGGSGGSAAGSGGSGGSGNETCQKGTTMGREVLFIGESFIAASTIPEETTKLARAAGSLGANDSYVDKSVSGTWLGNGAGNSIPNQYRNNSNGVRFVLMNGGGNDCWQGGQESHRTAALNAAEQLFADMAKNGVEKIVYFFYPDPIGSMYNNLKACLDVLRPQMKALCDGLGEPKCYWVDLRETWDGHPEYTRDGIHVDGPGNVPTATAIFNAMQANCVAP